MAKRPEPVKVISYSTVLQGSDEPMETGQVKTTEGIIYTPRGKITLVRTSKCSLMDIVYWEWNC
ncbi:hypothetical protein T4B_12843 [Trichinella pseudospiralis]|uniref:Uncharacterized protein n=1 Tax=Trichinella pseudospiralis TaxID=6337 RepID=A0A0V1HUV2_TRIPS|nr:hypothetical protein T4B_12843 [Trichinella pseudospiralis]KRZ43306.1 hypothetical protein T4C_11782 [Trichinella pseudospiralis]